MLFSLKIQYFQVSYNNLNTLSMKAYLSYLLLCCLLFSSFECVELHTQFKDLSHKPNLQKDKTETQQKSTIQAPSVFLNAINDLIKMNDFKNNNQFHSCFIDLQLQTLDLKIEQGLDLGRRLDQSSIEKYPSELMRYLRNYFSKKTLGCFFGSNDLKMLLLKYNIRSIQQGTKAFQDFSYQKFNQLHTILLTLIQLFKQRNLNNLTNYAHKSLIQVFKANLKSSDADEWGMTAIDPQLNKYPYFGITNSNGLIGAVSNSFPFQLSKTVLAGAYDKYGRGRVDNIVETMNLMKMQLAINGGVYPPLQEWNYKQYIDFKKAQFSGSYSMQDQASVQYKYVALKNSPTTFFLSTTITAHKDIRIDAKNGHLVPDYLNDVEKQFQNVPNKQIYRVITTKAVTKTNKIVVVLSSTFYVDDASKKYLTGDNLNHEDWDSNYHLHSLANIHVPKGQVFKFYLVSSLVSSQHHGDPKNQAIRLVLKAASTNSQQLLNKHYSLWQELWQSDIVIQGNSEDQKMIRSMIYHFYSFINEEKSYGLSPMGLSGLGYNGHVFWDMDLWMYPGILILNPKLGKSLIEYRYFRLEAARNNAFLNGYKGAMFPWESSKTGDEQCPIWAAPGPLEHHITGTVSVAAWKYYCVTKDLQWLKSKGREIIEGAAQFWQSRVQFDSDDGFYHINNVVAADQWAQNVDDDAFTNGVAIQSLRIANKMRTVLGIDTNKAWDQIRSKIIIHKFNDTNVTKQFSDYKGQNIKQADVNLLAYPLKLITNNTAVLKDLQYYETRVPVQGTPAMTHAIFALLYSRLGNSKKAYQLYKYSYANNLLTPFSVLAETQFGTNPYFLTGAGGIIQSVIFGFAGIDITDQGIKTIQTVIPDQWQRVVIKSPVLYTSNQNKANTDQKQADKK